MGPGDRLRLWLFVRFRLPDASQVSLPAIAQMLATRSSFLVGCFFCNFNTRSNSAWQLDSDHLSQNSWKEGNLLKVSMRSSDTLLAVVLDLC